MQDEDIHIITPNRNVVPACGYVTAGSANGRASSLDRQRFYHLLDCVEGHE